MLHERLQRGGVCVGPRELDQLWRYYVLLEKRNHHHGLTRVVGLDAVTDKHFLDCAVVPGLVELPASLLDIGTGAGFPGVVLKIMKPDLHVVLAEERQHKVAFLLELLKELGLDGIEVLPRRVVAGLSISVGGIITRALEPVASTLARCREFLASGGVAIFMKGPSVDDELRDAGRRARGAFVLSGDVAYHLPGTTYRRRIVVYERCAQGR
jgi:16S rRNA (guanine527-N7)-methyltransferase